MCVKDIIAKKTLIIENPQHDEMYHDNKYETAKNIYARSFMVEISEIHRTIEHRAMP